MGAPAPSWTEPAYRHLRTLLTAGKPPFPCYFGTIAEEAGALRYTWVDRNEVSKPDRLVSALSEFLEVAKGIKARTALIAFIEPMGGEATLSDYQEEFWNLLQYVHDHDPQPWPDDQPLDPDEPLWQFCFAGTPIFTTGHAPAYRRRQTRASQGAMLLVIQTKKNLEGVVGSSPAAERVRDRIRAMVRAYDDVEVSSDLGSFGEGDARDWRQSWLPDDKDQRYERCPLVLQRRSQP